MPRLLFPCALAALAACIQPAPGGGQGTSSPASAGSTPGAGSTSAGGTPTTPYHAPVPDDGTLGAIAPRTRIFPPDGHQFTSRSAVGDFDGDGVQDIAFELDFVTYVWFGPLPAGDLEATAAPARVGAAWLGVAGDIDGDGRDELAVDGLLVNVPGPGVYDDPKLIAAATVFVEGGVVSGPLADLDQDGTVDLVIPGKEALCVVYGPLAAPDLPSYCGVAAVPGSTSAVLHGPTSGCQFAFDDEVWALPDLSGDGDPELWASDESAHWTMTDGGCGVDTPDILVAGGDLRGQSLELAAAAHQSGLDYLLVPVGDLDGDGLPEMATGNGLYRATDLWTQGAAAAPFAWTSSASPGALDPSRTAFLDLSGDGHPEVLFIAAAGPLYALDGPEVSGEVSLVGATPIDSALQGVNRIADLDGDGVADGISAWDTEIRMYSGTELTQRWILAHP